MGSCFGLSIFRRLAVFFVERVGVSFSMSFEYIFGFGYVFVVVRVLVFLSCRMGVLDEFYVGFSGE